MRERRHLTFSLARCDLIFYSIYIYTHTHTYAYTYIYMTPGQEGLSTVACRESITKSKHVLYWKHFTPNFRR